MHDEHEIMSRRARRAHAEKQKRRARLPGLPFFLALGVLTVIAWILPLRPTVSAKEKRTLEAFPEFSLSAVTDGSYFPISVSGFRTRSRGVTAGSWPRSGSKRCTATPP